MLTPFPGTQVDATVDSDRQRLTPVETLDPEHLPEQVAFLTKRFGGRLHGMVRDGGEGKLLGGSEAVILQGQTPDQVFKVFRAEATPAELRAQRERWATLRSYFGDSPHCVLPRHHWWHVPTQEPGDDPEETRGFLVHQKILVPEVMRGYHLQVQADYPERHFESIDPDYVAATKRYVAGKTDVACPAFPMRPQDGLSEIMRHVDRVPSLGESLADFTDRAIRYCQDTGETIDFAGSDNVDIVWRDGRAQYVLLDPMHPHRDSMARAQAGAWMYYKHDICRKPNAASMKNGFLCTRTLNWMAERLGVRNRLDFASAGRPDHPDDIAYALERMPWTLLAQRIQAHEK